MGENMETPRPFDFAAHNEGVQSDLLQFADIIEFMLQHARKTVDPVASGVNDTSEELKELVTPNPRRLLHHHSPTVAGFSNRSSIAPSPPRAAA
jgi:hypothetical protein